MQRGENIDRKTNLQSCAWYLKAPIFHRLYHGLYWPPWTQLKYHKNQAQMQLCGMQTGTSQFNFITYFSCFQCSTWPILTPLETARRVLETSDANGVQVQRLGYKTRPFEERRAGDLHLGRNSAPQTRGRNYCHYGQTWRSASSSDHKGGERQRGALKKSQGAQRNDRTVEKHDSKRANGKIKRKRWYLKKLEK